MTEGDGERGSSGVRGSGDCEGRQADESDDQFNDEKQFLIAQSELSI